LPRVAYLRPELGIRSELRASLGQEISLWFHAVHPIARTRQPSHPFSQPSPVRTKAHNIERVLDTAFEKTFPASDPMAVDVTPNDESPAG